MNDRLERLAERAGMSRAELSRRAGLSDGYLSSTLSKVRADPTFTPDLATLRSIAQAAGVSLRWLETGEGEPEAALHDEHAPAPVRVRVNTPPGPTLVLDGYPDHLVALLWAFKRGDAYEPEDVLAALAASASGRAKLPNDREAAVGAMENILRAARRLRTSGVEVTMDALMWELAGGGPRVEPEK